MRRVDRLLPGVAAALALLVGLVLALRGWLRPASQEGADRIVFVSQSEGHGQLMLSALRAPESAQTLSGEGQDVLDYALSPDGRQVVYTARLSAAGDNSVWLLTLASGAREQLFDCVLSMCRSPDWSPGGDQIAYERRALIKSAAGDGYQLGPTRVWLLNLSGAKNQQLIADPAALGFAPRWSPDGSLLAYYNPGAEAVMVRDIAAGATRAFPSVLADPGNWSPDGGVLVYPNLVQDAGRAYGKLIRVDVRTGAGAWWMTQTVSNDSGVAWRPAGDGIAFIRHSNGGPAGPGGQIWQAGPDGGGARVLFAEPALSADALGWSASGEWLLHTRISLSEPGALPEVWVVARDGKESRRIAATAAQPRWLPYGNK